jgi:hypothetical protein
MSRCQCQYCHSDFVKQSVLRKHYERCKQKPLQELKEQYELRLQTQKEQYENQLEDVQKYIQNQKQQYEKDLCNNRHMIKELQTQIKELQNQIFEIAKQPKQINNHSNNTTTNNNQKTLNIMNQLAPYDLTTEMVQEILDKHALEKIFKDGPNSIADFVVEKILTDPDTQKPKLIATDRSRGVFKYKDTEGNVHVDNKLTKTTDILQRPLFKANDQVLLEIFKRHNFDIDDFTRNVFSENTDLLNSINKEKLSAKLCRRLEGTLDTRYLEDESLSGSILKF